MVLKSTVSWKMAGGAWASIVLTSTLRRRRTPRRNRSIPTILAGRSDGGIAHVSAVDTGLPAGSTPRSLGGRAGCSQPRAGPTIRCPTLSDSCPGGRWRRRDTGSGLHPPGSVYSTRTGIYWSRVVRTARRPHLPGVPPTLLQRIPTLVQYRPGAIPATAGSRTAPAAGRVRSRGPGPPAPVS
ncbi:hypothetical protein BKH22_10050 [Actinomyces oris]|nr:hypothetical protein BKH22_10050 [Actinomyces oris]